MPKHIKKNSLTLNNVSSMFYENLHKTIENYIKLFENVFNTT